MFLSVSVSAFLSASLFLSLLLLFAFSLFLKLSPLSFLPLTLPASISASTRLSFLSLSPHPLFPTSTLPRVSSLSPLLSVPLGASLCHLLYSVSLPPTFLFVGYTSWQPLMSGWSLTVCVKISAGDPMETRIPLLPSLLVASSPSTYHHIPCPSSASPKRKSEK